MAAEAGEVRHTDEWGPVSRGFRVSLPSGERGCVEEITLRGGAVEFVVATGLFVRRLVTVRAHEIEAILPATRRIVVRGSNGGAPHAEDAATEVEAVGGIVRMPVRHSSRIGSPPMDAA
jgi:hypothetical protein